MSSMCFLFVKRFAHYVYDNITKMSINEQVHSMQNSFYESLINVCFAKITNMR